MKGLFKQEIKYGFKLLYVNHGTKELLKTNSNNHTSYSQKYMIKQFKETKFILVVGGGGIFEERDIYKNIYFIQQMFILKVKRLLIFSIVSLRWNSHIVSLFQKNFINLYKYCHIWRKCLRLPVTGNYSLKQGNCTLPGLPTL